MFTEKVTSYCLRMFTACAFSPGNAEPWPSSRIFCRTAWQKYRDGGNDGNTGNGLGDNDENDEVPLVFFCQLHTLPCRAGFQGT